MAVTSTMRTQITQLYVALFGRAPEADGFAYWVGMLESGKTFSQVAQAMYDAPAAKAVYPAFLLNAEVITKFYTNVLGRQPDQAGLDYWTAQLNTKTKGQVIADMVNAVTTYAGTDTAALDSKAFFNAKVDAGLTYVLGGGNDPANKVIDAIVPQGPLVDAVAAAAKATADAAAAATTANTAAATAATSVETATAANTAAAAKAATSDAAALKVTNDASAATAAAAVTAAATTGAAVVAAQAALNAAIATGVVNDINTANAKLLIAQAADATAKANVTSTASAAATVKAAYDAAVADDTAAANAATALSAAITAAGKAADDAIVAAAAQAKAAAAQAAAAAKTTATADDATAADAVKAAAAASATAASAKGTVEVLTLTGAYATAKAASDAAAADAATKAAAAAAAIAATNSAATADAAIAAAAAETKAAALAKTTADATLAAANALAAAAAKTTTTADDTTASAAVTAATAQQTAAATAVANAAADTTTSAALPAAYTPKTLNLITGVDALVGGSGNDVFNSVPTALGGATSLQPTLTALDSIDGGAGTGDTLNVVADAAFTVPATATVKNVEIVNLTGSNTVQGDVSKWTGLTTLSVGQFGGAGSIVAGAATDVTLVDSAAAATTTTVDGGKNVKLTINGVTSGGSIIIGQTTQATGTVDLTTNMLATQTGVANGKTINVKGGTSINVTANLVEKAGSGNTVTGGTVTVTGDSNTTSVNVTQSKATSAQNSQPDLPFFINVTAVAAQPGVNAVAGKSGSATTSSTDALAGVVAGQVSISDASSGAGTIKTVTLKNFGAASSITSNALTDLTLAGNVTDNSTLTLTRSSTLASDTLNLNLAAFSPKGSSGTITINDANAEIKTLNVNMAGSSRITTITDSSLKTLNVSGSGTFTFSNVSTSLDTIAISGSAGFSDGSTGRVSALGSGLKSFTTTSTGSISAWLDAATQSFTGAAGKTTITIAADALKKITGGTGSSDMLVLNNVGSTFNADTNKYTTTNVTGFEVLGLNTSSSGNFDMSTLPTGLAKIEFIGNAGGVTNLLKVAANTALAIDTTQSNAIVYQTAAATAATDSVSLSLGTTGSFAPNGYTFSSLTLKDANDVGFGTLNVASNVLGAPSLFNSTHTITTLVDNGLSNLNVTGNANLTIGTLNQASTQATSFTINNTSTGASGVKITTFTDANLGSVTFKGTGAGEITTLTGITGNALTLANTGSSTAKVGTLTTTSLTSLTLTGDVALGANTTTASTAIGSSNGVTVSGATDNAHVNISLTGAAATKTDTITLGNGNNYITDLSTAGVVNVTVGSGANLIDVSTGTASTYTANITLGAHTNTTAAYNKLLVSVSNAQTDTVSTVVTGTTTGDVIVFRDASDVTFVKQSTGNAAIIAADTTLVAAVNHALGETGMNAGHTVTAFQWQGNTYVVNNVGADTANTAGTDTVVKLVGLHTVADFGSVVGAVTITV